MQAKTFRDARVCGATEQASLAELLAIYRSGSVGELFVQVAGDGFVLIGSITVHWLIFRRHPIEDRQLGVDGGSAYEEPIVGVRSGLI